MQESVHKWREQPRHLPEDAPNIIMLDAAGFCNIIIALLTSTLILRGHTMSAYIVVTREEPIRDTEAMAEYQRRTRNMKGEFNLKPLAIYGTTETVEGEAPDGVIILEFPTLGDARAWYHSPAYQAAVPFRIKAAKHRVIIVEGL